jgi:hypothetical protein
MRAALARLYLREVEQVAHQFLQTHAVFAAGFEHFALLVRQFADRAFEHEVDGHLHARQRRPQLVRSRRDELRLEAVYLA